MADPEANSPDAPSPRPRRAAGAASTVELIAGTLRHAIVAGRYAPGHRMIESDLTRELQVSRGPLREALRRLASEGLVDLQHHRGARVRRMSRAEVAALYEVRELLESLAARSAARSVAAGRVDPAPLGQLVQDMDRALDGGALGRYLDLNQRFHEQLVDWSGNSTLASLIPQLQVAAFRLQFRSLVGLTNLREGQADHRLIAAAVVAGDEDSACERMRHHIRRSAAETRTMSDTSFDGAMSDKP